MRKALIAVLAVMTLSLAGVAGAQQNPAPTWRVLQNDDQVTEQFAGTTTMRLYAFNATAGDRAVIDMVQQAESPFDPFIVLLGPDGQLIGFDDDSGDFDLAARLVVDIPESGSYILLVSGKGSFNTLDGTGQPLLEIPEPTLYVVAISGITTPDGFPPDRVSPSFSDLFLNTSFDAGISTNFPAWYMFFEGERLDTYDLTLQSDFDNMLMVFDPNGNRIGVNDDDPTGFLTPGNAAIRDLTLETTGSYFVIATHLTFWEEETLEGLEELPQELRGFQSQLVFSN